MFVLKASKNSTSMARIRQWLILLLRMLALAFLIIAIARPLLGGWLSWQFSSSPDTVIILLDRSASMGTTYQAEKDCLEQGLDLLVGAGEKLAPDARIVLIDNAGMTASQIPNWQVLKELVDTKVTQTAADIPAMFRAALDYLLKNGTGVTELWCLSDLQKSNWQPANNEWSELEEKFQTLSQPLTVKILAVKSSKSGNRSIALMDSINYHTPEEEQIFELVFSVVADDLKGKTEVPVVIFNNGIKQQRNIKLSGGDSRIRLRVPSPEKDKTNYGYIALPPDCNAQDNLLYFAYDNMTEAKIAVYSGNAFLREVFSAAVNPERNPENISAVASLSAWNDTDFSDKVLIIWQGNYPEGELGSKLNTYLDQGGVAVFFPPVSQNEEKTQKNSWGSIVSFSEEKAQKVVDWNHSSGPLADTASGSQLPVDSLKLLKRRSLSGSLSDATAFCADGRPFLYNMFYGEYGKLYFCTTLPLKNWSNLGDGIIMVPMLQRMLKEGSKRFSRIVYVSCGKSPDVLSAMQPLIRFQDVEEDFDQDSRFQTGIFLDDQKYTVINRPLIEDIRGNLDEESVKGLFKEKKIYLFNESVENDSVLQTEIWRWFLIAMFCFLIAESVLLTPGREAKNKEKTR